jgi:hypothetical protein
MTETNVSAAAVRAKRPHVSSPNIDSVADTATAAYWNRLAGELLDAGVPAEKFADVEPTLQGILELEELAIHYLPPERLIRRAWIIRNRYREVAGERKYSLYTASNPPALNLPAEGQPDKVDVLALKADLLELHREMAREYIFGNALEYQRAQLARRATIIGIGALMLLAITILWYVLDRRSQNIAAWVAGIIVFIFVGVAFRRSWVRSQQVAGTTSAILLALFLPLAMQAQTTTQTTTTTAQPPKTATTAPPKTATAPTAPTTTAPTTTATATTATTTATTTTATTPQSTLPFRTEEKVTGDPGPATTLTMVVLAGVLGATFSLMRRAQTPITEGDVMRNVQNLAALDTYFFLTPLTGAIAALVLYAFFCGGLLQGSLFPTISAPQSLQPMRFIEFLRNADPVGWTDQGKVLVWCFIAGFAERLVPDSIDRLTSAAEKK